MVGMFTTTQLTNGELLSNHAPFGSVMIQLREIWYTEITRCCFLPLSCLSPSLLRWGLNPGPSQELCHWAKPQPLLISMNGLYWWHAGRLEDKYRSIPNIFLKFFKGMVWDNGRVFIIKYGFQICKWIEYNMWGLFFLRKTFCTYFLNHNFQSNWEYGSLRRKKAFLKSWASAAVNGRGL